VDDVDLTWGAFGTNSSYIKSWEVLGQLDQENIWIPVAGGGFPNAAETLADIHRVLRKLRIRAAGSNWIGVYEMSVYGSP
jgi:hypothetical protein